MSDRAVSIGWVLLVLACEAPPPELVGIEPSRFPATEQTSVGVFGRHFEPETRGDLVDPDAAAVNVSFHLELVNGDTVIELNQVTYLSTKELSAVVMPVGYAGRFTLRLTDPRGRIVELANAVETFDDIVGPPCTSSADCADDPCSDSDACVDGRCEWDKDTDDDGYVDVTCGGTDCDDDPTACGAACNPSLVGNDHCDSYDNDCDTELDEDIDRIWYHDADGDGYTNNADTMSVCADPGLEWVDIATANDCADSPAPDPLCNDLDGAMCNPGLDGSDICDGADNDCDTELDEDIDRIWYHDWDGDGFTNNNDTQTVCADPGAEWESSPSTVTDCDDDPVTGCGDRCNSLETESPGAGNCDDTYDNDCDGWTDLADVDCLVASNVRFRSVGPGRTGPIADGAANPLEVSGGLAQFVNPLPLDLGVGDVIVYGADNELAVVQGRLDVDLLAVTTAAGAVATVTSSPDSSWRAYRAYTALAEAITGDENLGIPVGLRDFDDWPGGHDLVTDDEIWRIACYGDAPDTTTVTLNNWTTDVDHFLHIFTPHLSTHVGVSQRHPGSWDASSYVLEGDVTAIAINMPNVWIEGLQIEISGDHFLNAGINILMTGTGYIRISHNLITAPSATGTLWAAIGAVLVGADPAVYVYNNVIFDVGPGGDGVGTTGGTWFVSNNTIYSVGNRGVVNNLGATYTARNNIVQQATTAFSGTFTATSGTNISDDGTDTGAVTDQQATLTFANPGAGDLHLDVTDTEAIDQGIDLSSEPAVPITDDVDGEPRSGSWDIGADER